MAAMAPKFYEAMIGLEMAARGSGIDAGLYELIKIRASQLNGCAYCLDMHCRDARQQGEDQRRLDVLSAWREAASLCSEVGQAALELAESATLIANGGVPQRVWDRLAVATHKPLPDTAH